MKHIIFIIVFLFNQSSWASCPNKIMELKKGEPAPCSGLLFSPKASEEVDNKLEELEYNKKLVTKLLQRQGLTDKYIDTVEKRLQLYMNQSYTLAQELNRKENEDKWQKALYFTLGIAAFYGASKLRR